MGSSVRLMYGADELFLMLDQSVFSITMRNTVRMAPDGRVVVRVVLVVVEVVVRGRVVVVVMVGVGAVVVLVVDGSVTVVPVDGSVVVVGDGTEDWPLWAANTARRSWEPSSASSEFCVPQE